VDQWNHTELHALSDRPHDWARTTEMSRIVCLKLFIFFSNAFRSNPDLSVGPIFVFGLTGFTLFNDSTSNRFLAL
jgi:hypothetical protein